jgi:hypothetical protein
LSILGTLVRPTALPLDPLELLACSRFAEKLDLLRYQRDARNRRSTVIGRMNS